MKKKVLFLLSTLIICLTFTACEQAVKPDTVVNTAWLMKVAIDDGDYERFNALFSDTRKSVIAKETFDALKAVTTAGSSYTHYELVTFENGEMLLVQLIPEPVNGEYRIEDVIVVPNDMKAVFNGAVEEIIPITIGRINSVEVVNGMTGERVIFDDEALLNELEKLFQTVDLKLKSSEDVSGYKRSIVVKGFGTLVLLNADLVTYNGSVYSFVDSTDFQRIEELLGLSD